ncbi:hypothetical protein EON83_09965 [bacterium]|nr:MAG: hypothetical protein EON83_09965 [bacterium]
MANHFVIGDVNFRAEVQVHPEQLLESFGPRFDNTAMVKQIWLGGNTVLTPNGLTDEFGIDGIGVLGFGEAPTGGRFLKIGVGELVRADGKEDYRFWNRYSVQKLAPVRVAVGRNSLTVSQQASLDDNYGYHYEKQYRVLPDSKLLVILYRLKNSGKLPFKFNQYNHNWFDSSGPATAPGYFVETAFDFSTPSPAYWLAQSRGAIFSHRLSTPQPVTESKIFHSLLGARASNNKLLVDLPGKGLQVEVGGNFDIARFALYAEPSALCPEVFIESELQPGKSQSWTRSYQLKDNRVPLPATTKPHPPMPLTDSVRVNVPLG